MSQKVVISCAVTGSIHVPSQSPYLPITPDRIFGQGNLSLKPVISEFVDKTFYEVLDLLMSGLCQVFYPANILLVTDHIQGFSGR